MNKIVRFLDQWTNKFIRFAEGGKTSTINRKLSEEESLKEQKDSEEESRWEEEIVVMPDTYIVTQTGQFMRDPVKRKYHFKRSKVKNRES